MSARHSDDNSDGSRRCVGSVDIKQPCSNSIVHPRLPGVTPEVENAHQAVIPKWDIIMREGVDLTGRSTHDYVLRQVVAEFSMQSVYRTDYQLDVSIDGSFERREDQSCAFKCLWRLA